MDDPLRPETPRAIRSLRRIGFTRIVMVTGDNASVADIIGSAIGVDAVLADRVPSEKVDAVRAERSDASGPIVMVGDGLNDAPALALADVGVAMGARGASASSEAADIVITVDRLDRLTEAVQIARRARSIAIQSVVLGMGMSIVAMARRGRSGCCPVVAGAILQEAIDVVVILNALRALRGGVEVPVQIPGWTETSARLRAAHLELEPSIARIRATADVLDSMPPAAAAGRPRGDPPVRVGRPPAARGAGGPDHLPDARRARWARTTRPRRCTARTRRSSGARGCSIAWSATSRRRARAATTGRTSSASSTAWKRSCACIRRRRRTCTCSIGDSSAADERPAHAASPVPPGRPAG